MNEVAIQSIVVGGVAILSALIGGILPNFISRKNETIALKRQKLEELYVNIENWYNTAFSMYFFEFKLVMDKHIDWNAYLDRIIEMEKKGDHIKSEIILYLYFIEIEKEFIQLRESVHELSRYVDNDIKNAYLSGIDISVFKDEYMDRIHTANRALKTLKISMQKIAQNIR